MRTRKSRQHGAWSPKTWPRHELAMRTVLLLTIFCGHAASLQLPVRPPACPRANAALMQFSEAALEAMRKEMLEQAEAAQEVARAQIAAQWVALESALPATESRGAPVLTLYRDTNGWCPFCERVWLQLEHKGLPYEEVLIDLKDKPAWYLEMVPTGLVPAVKIEASGEVRRGAVVAGPGLGLVTVACCGPGLRLVTLALSSSPTPGPGPSRWCGSRRTSCGASRRTSAATRRRRCCRRRARPSARAPRRCWRRAG